MLTHAPSPIRRRRMVAGLAAAGLAAGALALGAGPAAAAPTTAVRCVTTQFPLEHLCARLHRNGLHVDRMEIDRTKFYGGAIRDHHHEITVRHRGDIWLRQSSAPSGNTAHGQVRDDAPIDSSFRTGSRICARFFEAGELQGAVCFRLRSPGAAPVQENGRRAPRTR
jgi:hypothetical protein